MVAPSGEGAVRCMRQAMEDLKGARIDYINPHATSTPVGDDKEIEAIREVFGAGEACPPISATKSLTGHSLGATGVQEAIYALLMMNNGFICESAHIDELDPPSPTCRSCASAGTACSSATSCRTPSASAARTRPSCSSTRTRDRSRCTAPRRAASPPSHMRNQTEA